MKDPTAPPLQQTGLQCRLGDDFAAADFDSDGEYDNGAEEEEDELLPGLSGRGGAIKWLANDFFRGKKDNWAGASHWRYRAPGTLGAKKTAGDNEDDDEEDAGAGTKKRASKSKSKKDATYIDFEDPPELEDASFAPVKKASEITLQTLQATNTLLPKDLNYEPSELVRLFLRPYHIAASGPSDRNFDREAAGPAPAVDYAAVGGDDDDYDDYAGDYDLGSFENFAAPQASAENNSATMRLVRRKQIAIRSEMHCLTNVFPRQVEAPRKVAQLQINYARVSKQVDVRALKQTLWAGLQSIATQGGSTSFHVRRVRLKSVAHWAIADCHQLT